MIIRHEGKELEVRVGYKLSPIHQRYRVTLANPEGLHHNGIDYAFGDQIDIYRGELEVVAITDKILLKFNAISDDTSLLTPPYGTLFFLDPEEFYQLYHATNDILKEVYLIQYILKQVGKIQD